MTFLGSARMTFLGSGFGSDDFPGFGLDDFPGLGFDGFSGLGAGSAVRVATWLSSGWRSCGHVSPGEVP